MPTIRPEIVLRESVIASNDFDVANPLLEEV